MRGGAASRRVGLVAASVVVGLGVGGTTDAAGLEPGTGTLEDTVGTVGTDSVDSTDSTDSTDSIVGIVGEPVPTGWRFDSSVTTMAEVRATIGADVLWSHGHTGRGVGVALVDTGVVPVEGLTDGTVTDGADLSFESQAEGLRHLDSFGHGTHLAGIIAGRDPGGVPGTPDGATGADLGADRFLGVAPDARLTSVKVAASDGAVDVSQVVAAVDWVVEHRADDPTHPVRVLNLSYGTDGVQDYRVDPLTHAVENAWRAGIVVVVAGGNEGFGAGQLNNPALDPHVIAVGAADGHGTTWTGDDTVADYSSRGDASRRVDLTAPGRSVASLRDPGSYLDEAHPGARYGERLFKGSGTSQAAAVVSGAVALLLDQRPWLTPDQVKALLTGTAAPMPLADPAGRGAGEVDLAAAALAPAPSTAAATQPWPESAGTGSLEAARGSQHVADGDVELTGERDILGPWHADRWAAASAAGTSWEGGRFNNRDWTGTCWCTATWAGPAWETTSWSGRSWAGRSWAGRSWAGRSWAGRSWAGEAWAGRSWAGRSWAGDGWS